MDTAVARVGLGSLLVRCRICGRASHGAKLCDQCVAAVKRARHVRTITSEFLPQSGLGAAASPKVAAQRTSRRRRPARWSWLPAKPEGWIVVIAFGLFGAAVGATGYLAIEEIAEAALAVGMQGATEPAPSRAGLPIATDPAAPLASVAPASASASADAAPSPGDFVGAPASDAGAVMAEPKPLPPIREKRAPRESATEQRPGKSAPTRNPREASARAADAEAIAAPDAGAQPSAPTIASAAIAPEPQAPDRWETMSAALSSCARESFLADVVCAERVRHQYCEGFWGQVPQCRAATRPGASR